MSLNDHNYTVALINKALRDIERTGTTDTLSFFTLLMDNQLNDRVASEDWTPNPIRSQWGYQVETEHQAKCLMEYALKTKASLHKMDKICKKIGL